jgi:catalase
MRRNHTKGVGCLGTFTATDEARTLSRSKLFTGKEIPVVARFSIAGGDPEVPDADRSPRGLACEFRLGDGSLHHMTMLNTPMFFAKVPQTFIDKFAALAIDPATGKANPALLRAFIASRTETHNQVAFLNANNPPRSYTSEAYFGIHTFFLRDRSNRLTKFKYYFRPRDGVDRLSSEEMASAPQDFLEKAMAERMERGPVLWDLIFIIGEPDDEELDPTVLWPDDRREVFAGTLKLESWTHSAEAGSYRINFDPLMLSEGVEPSRDPVLLFRSPSYAISHGRRLQGV